MKVRDVVGLYLAPPDRAIALCVDEKSQVQEAGESLIEKLTVIEATLYQTKNESSQDPLNFPIRLNNRLNALGSNLSVGNYPPTAQVYAFLV